MPLDKVTYILPSPRIVTQCIMIVNDKQISNQVKQYTHTTVRIRLFSILMPMVMKTKKRAICSGKSKVDASSGFDLMMVEVVCKFVFSMIIYKKKLICYKISLKRSINYKEIKRIRMGGMKGVGFCIYNG